MVLAEAFMKRNDLKKQIAKLTELATDNLWQDKTLPINFDKGTKVHPVSAYGKVVAKMAELQALNVAIAKANGINSEVLRDLETTTAAIAFHEQIVEVADRYPGDKVRDRDYVDNAVVSITRENEWLIDPQSVQERLAELRNHKRDLEKTLAHNNFVTEVLI